MKSAKAYESVVVELSSDDIAIIVASTYFQYTAEKNDKYKEEIKGIHKKISKLINLRTDFVLVPKSLILEA